MRRHDPFQQRERLALLHGDCRQLLKTLPSGAADCCVTSPPYWGLRDYGTAGQLGLEATPAAYVKELVKVFREVRRVLKDDGTLWLNLGDTYNGNRGPADGLNKTNHEALPKLPTGYGLLAKNLKPKDLVGIPWMVAFALRADGWYLRSDIIWHKPNPMPESVTDRPTKAHEYIFLLSKSQKYHYDDEAIKELASDAYANDSRWDTGATAANDKEGYELAGAQNPKAPHKVFNGPPRITVNKRTVWTVPTAPYSGAHFATFPPDLITPCVLAGCPAGGVVLDPFAGSGTTGKVALELACRAILIELNPAYVKLAEKRTIVTFGLPF